MVINKKTVIGISSALICIMILLLNGAWLTSFIFGIGAIVYFSLGLFYLFVLLISLISVSILYIDHWQVDHFGQFFLWMLNFAIFIQCIHLPLIKDPLWKKYIGLFFVLLMINIFFFTESLKSLDRFRMMQSKIYLDLEQQCIKENCSSIKKISLMG